MTANFTSLKPSAPGSAGARRDRTPSARPEQCKIAADALGLRSVEDFLVLHRNNDPFGIGRAGQVRDAKWFAERWEAARYAGGAHLRRFHYRLFSTEPHSSVPVYENTPMNGVSLPS
jgi:hypothetical protein